MDLIRKCSVVDGSLDTVIIQQPVTDIAGGIVLNTDGYNGEFIYAGQPITESKDEGGKSVYKPLNVTKEPEGGEKGTLAAAGEGEKVIGFAVQTKEAEFPHVGVVTSGSINSEAAYFDIKEFMDELGFKDQIK